MSINGRTSLSLLNGRVGVVVCAFGNGRLSGRTICYTTPSGYAERLKKLLIMEGSKPVWCPSVVVETTGETKRNVLETLTLENVEERKPVAAVCSAVAFTSRAGIAAFADALQQCDSLDPPVDRGPLTLGALGKDVELLKSLNVFVKLGQYRILAPSVATPKALAEELGQGHGRKVLCPVPLVVGLSEPSVVPDFLEALDSMDWDVVRVNSYVTRWAGPACAKNLIDVEDLDVLIFTSTAEVQGLLKSLHALGLDWEGFRHKYPKLLVAAHGPVTAAGANSMGVQVDVVGQRFESFNGVIDTVALKLAFR